MNFKHQKNIQESIDGMKKIFSISWSLNLMRLAVAHVDEKRNVRISLFDESGERRETFPTRAANKTNKSYVVRDLAFSPDSTKLAVSQSDNIVFIYNLGLNWGDKKTICNKFEQNTQVTSLIWPVNRPNELYFGVAEGKVKLGMLKSNSAQILYSTDSYVVTMCCSQDGKLIFSGHVDNSIYKYNMEMCSATKFINFTSVPYCLSCGIQNHILVAGNDCKIIFYSDMGEKLQNFDYSHDEKLKDFTLSRVNSAYDSIAVGNFDKFFIFMYNTKKNQWEEVCVKNVENYYTVTALCWKPEVNTLVIGSLCGSIDIFESCLKKSIYGEKYEITYISHYQVIVKDLESGRRVTIKSNFSNEITKLSIQNENFVIINTKDSLIVADLTTGKSSEIQGNFSGSEKYDFSNPNVCMIYQLGEITIIEYGNNEIIGYFRTEFVHPNLISARIYTQQELADKNSIKIVSYLIDPFTIYIQDLITQNLIISISHESPIEFLDLNRNGTKLLFRDNKRHLYLYLLNENRKVTLLNFCGFVQWVPGAEVLVAQDRKNMIVWYNIDDLDNFKTISIKGDIEEVKRLLDHTEVLVDECGESKIYLLDEKLIGLSTAIEIGDLNRAMAILENLSICSNQGVPSANGSSTYSTEADVYWKALARTALQKKNLLITQRCFAALGAYSKVNYIKKIMKDVESLGVDHPVVEAKLLILDKQFLSAESLLLNNKLVSEAISIFNEIHRFEESVKIAEKYNIPEYKEIQTKYYNWLIENELFDKAAEVKIKERNFMDAIKLYIQGDLYIKASNLITRERLATGVESHIIDFLVTSMIEIGVYEKAAELLEYTKEYEKAIELYIRANCFPKALEMSKSFLNKEKNKKIEELWGDYLTTQRQVEQSVGHYIDAGRYEKAIEALINSRKWEKASDLCEEVVKKNINISISLETFFSQIGEHYLKERNFDLAEKFFIKGKNFENIIEIFIKNKKWERLENFIEKYSYNVIEREKIKNIIIEIAIKYEKDSTNPKYKEAEKLYIYANEPDLAITMYKNLRNFEEMIKLVEIHMPDYLSATITMIAQLCEEENCFKQAEKYYTYGESPDWNSCIDMYYKNKMFEDCIRVADKFSTDDEEFINICQGIFKDNVEEAKSILLKLNLINHCIKFLCFIGNLEEAKNLAQSKSKDMIPYVNFKYGLFFKLNNNFEKAEECFINAKKFKEIISMYLDMEDFNNSLRVCRKYCEDLIPEIYFRQGSFYLKKFELDKAEICFSKTNRPEVFFEFLLENNYRDRAIAYAERYAPHLLNNENKHDYMRELMENIDNNKIRYVISRCIELENSKNYQEAIEAYLQLHQQEIKNKSHLIIIYQKVLELCKFTDKDYKKKIIELIVRKYLSLEEYKKAADLLKYIQNYEEAMTCYIMGNEVREAENMIHEIDDPSQREFLLVKLTNKIKTDDPQNYDNLINEGRYEECLKNLKDQKSEMFSKYFIKISSIYFNNKQYLDLALMIIRIDSVFNNKTLSILKTLALEILAEENLEELENLKIIFGKNENIYIRESGDLKLELERLHKITHYQVLKFQIKEYENKFSELYYCLCLCVLQYGDIIKLDLAFLDALKICNIRKMNGNSFVFTNAYLDLFECIQYAGNPEDDQELKSAGIIMKNCYLSANNLMSVTEKEELNKWVLSKSVDKNFEKNLIKIPCLKCNFENFEGCINCFNCGLKYEQCILSGFPISANLNNYNQCNKCNKKILSKFWTEWIKVFHYCPWCQAIYN